MEKLREAEMKTYPCMKAKQSEQILMEHTKIGLRLWYVRECLLSVILNEADAGQVQQSGL